MPTTSATRRDGSRPHTIFRTLIRLQECLGSSARPPLAHEKGWKDTVALETPEEALVMIRFEQSRGRYMLHCHNLEHEDHAMMSRFDVL